MRKAVLPQSSEINVTPMLDVLLVLLVTFMAAVVPFHRTVDVSLPVPCTGSCEGAPTIVLEVSPGPTYRVNRTPVAPGTLAATLRGVYTNRPDKTIQIASGAGVSYQTIVDAIDVAKSAGVVIVGIAPSGLSAQR